MAMSRPAIWCDKRTQCRVQRVQKLSPEITGPCTSADHPPCRGAHAQHPQMPARFGKPKDRVCVAEEVRTTGKADGSRAPLSSLSRARLEASSITLPHCRKGREKEVGMEPVGIATTVFVQEVIVQHLAGRQISVMAPTLDLQVASSKIERYPV